MKRVLSLVHGAATSVLVAWGVAICSGRVIEAVRSQLEYGYAVDRVGRPYNVWQVPLVYGGVFLGSLLVIALLDWIRGRKAGQVPGREDNVPLPQHGSGKRGRPHR